MQLSHIRLFSHSLQVKGIDAPLQTYLVSSEKRQAFDMLTRGVAGTKTRTVGREKEMQQLQKAYESAVSSGSMRWITLSAEAGIGKSRLLSDFVEWLENLPSRPNILKGRAWSHTQQTPYFLLRDLLSSSFNIREDDPLAEAREKLTTGFCGVLGDENGVESAALVGQLIGFDFLSTSPELAPLLQDSGQVRNKAIDHLRQFLDAASKITPLVHLIEDLHWADEESLNLMNELYAQEAPWRLCLVVATRPRFWQTDREWEKVEHHHRIDLKPLQGHDSRVLVDTMLQKLPERPPWLIQMLIERGAGNPFFTEELVNWLAEQRIINITPTEWQLTGRDLSGLAVPTTVQGVLQARLGRLQPVERYTLERAAVMGHAFWDGAVAYIGQENVPSERWQLLQHRNYVLEEPVSQLINEDEFRFRHVLLRDVVYEFTLLRVRREFHQRAAEWLIQNTGERVGEWAAVIAQHYEAGGLREEAADWYEKAAVHALYSPAESIRFCQQALNLLPQIRQENANRYIAIYERMAQSYNFLARYEDLFDAFDKMRQAAEVAQDIQKQAHATCRKARMEIETGRLAEAKVSIENVHKLLKGANLTKTAEFAFATTLEGLMAYREGNTRLSAEKCRAALNVAIEVDAKAEIGFSRTILAISEENLGRWRSAAQLWQENIAFYETHNARRQVSIAKHNLAENWRKLGEYEKALEQFLIVLELTEEMNDQRTRTYCRSNIGANYVVLGRFVEAKPYLEKALEAWEAANSPDITYTGSYLTMAYVGLEKLAEGEQTIHKVFSYIDEVGARQDEGLAWHAAALLAAALPVPLIVRGQPMEAEDCFSESDQVYTELQDHRRRSLMLRDWAKYLWKQGEHSQGQAYWDEAKQIFTELVIEAELGRMGATPADSP